MTNPDFLTVVRACMELQEKIPSAAMEDCNFASGSMIRITIPVDYEVTKLWRDARELLAPID